MDKSITIYKFKMKFKAMDNNTITSKLFRPYHLEGDLNPNSKRVLAIAIEGPTYTQTKYNTCTK
jgi:hypothetical protein